MIQMLTFHTKTHETVLNELSADKGCNSRRIKIEYVFYNRRIQFQSSTQESHLEAPHVSISKLGLSIMHQSIT